MYPSERVKTFIKTDETLVSPARHLPADPPSIITGGYGETDSLLVHPGMIVPPELAETWLDKRIFSLSRDIELKIGAVIFNQGQFDAIFHTCYNVGIGFLSTEHDPIHIIRDHAYSLVPQELRKWDKAAGVSRRHLYEVRCLECDWWNGDREGTAILRYPWRMK